MLNKIDIPGTSITLEIVDKTITITNKIEYDMQMHFRNADADTSLDASGDVFEPLYWLDIRQHRKFRQSIIRALESRGRNATWPSFRSSLSSLRTTSEIYLTFVVLRENYNEKSDLIVGHFNHCDRMGLI